MYVRLVGCHPNWQFDFGRWGTALSQCTRGSLRLSCCVSNRPFASTDMPVESAPTRLRFCCLLHHWIPMLGPRR